MMIKIPTHDINPLFSASSINNRYTCMCYVLALLCSFCGHAIEFGLSRGEQLAYACLLACWSVPISRLWVRVWSSAARFAFAAFALLHGALRDTTDGLLLHVILVYP